MQNPPAVCSHNLSQNFQTFIILLEIEAFVTFPVRFHLTLKKDLRPRLEAPVFFLLGYCRFKFFTLLSHRRPAPTSSYMPSLHFSLHPRRSVFSLLKRNVLKSHLPSIIAVTFSAIFSLSSHTQFTLFTCNFFRWKMTSVCTTPRNDNVFFLRGFSSLEMNYGNRSGMGSEQERQKESGAEQEWKLYQILDLAKGIWP